MSMMGSLYWMILNMTNHIVEIMKVNFLNVINISKNSFDLISEPNVFVDHTNFKSASFELRNELTFSVLHDRLKFRNHMLG